MRRYALLLALAAGSLLAHDVFSTKITWSRDISRIVVKRCLGCHQEGGKAFSLKSFDEARPWAKAIKEEVLNRRMPPWGAVKGFGEFKNDPSLTQEEIGLIADWVEGGSPQGEKIYLPDMKAPLLSPPARVKARAKLVSGSLTLTGSGTLVAIEPQQLGGPAQLVAQLPDGSIEPLVWILNPAQAIHRQYQYDGAVQLPKGTRISSSQGTWQLLFK